MITLFTAVLVAVVVGLVVIRPSEWRCELGRFHLSELLAWRRPVGRGPYLLAGVLLFILKYQIDRFLYHRLYHSTDPWDVLDYFFLFRAIGRQVTRNEFLLLEVMFAVAVPFIAVGVILTLRRLRDVQLPDWLVLFFFVPLLNLLFFFMLSILPSRELTGSETAPRPGGVVRRVLDRTVPRSSLGSAVAALMIVSVFALLAVLLGVNVFRGYGVSLFVASPFCQGLMAALIFGYRAPRTLRGCLGVAGLSVLILSGLLILFAMEGAICVLMALPIALVTASFGAALGYVIQQRTPCGGDTATTLLLLFLMIPALMAAEYAERREPATGPVVSTVTIHAPADVVWKTVIAFPELPPPQHFIFKAGVAYPTHAVIHGRGVGAVRECHFSTGAFVEPITDWEEDRLLRFDVVDQPDPMRELSPYRNIRPPHLDGFLASRRGQFLLTELPDGAVQLEGTTWYDNRMWPQWYWRWWSDLFIHQIHLRVLEHIKGVSESRAAG